MATGESKETVSFSVFLDYALDSMLDNLHLEKVDFEMTNRLPKKLASRVKRMVEKKDVRKFCSLLKMFDPQSFVVFLEALESIQDNKHNQIIDVLGHKLESVTLVESYKDIETKLLSIYPTKQHCCQALQAKQSTGEEMVETEVSSPCKSEVYSESLATLSLERQKELTGLESETFSQTDGNVLYYDHPVERAEFHKPEHQCPPHKVTESMPGASSDDDDPSSLMSKQSTSTQNVLDSNIHDVTVEVDPKAFPEHLDTFSMSLTINDYSKPVTIPDHCSGVYSALVSLTCDPDFEKFPERVTVTIPHCAYGDTDSLCVLTAPESESGLKEDPDIIIESCDNYYLTFKTIHFCRFRLSRSKHPIQRKLKCVKIRKLPLSAMRKAISLNKPEVQSEAQHLPRTYSCPTKSDVITTSKFVAVMYRPKYTSAAYWQVVFFVTYHLSSFIEVNNACILCVPC